MIKIEIDVNVKGLEVLEKIFGVSHSCSCEGNKSEPVQQPVQQPAQQTVQQPAQQSAQTPVQQPVQTPTATVAYNFDQIQNCAATLARSGKRDGLMAVIKSLGVNALTDVPQNRYNELAAKLRELGGVL